MRAAPCDGPAVIAASVSASPSTSLSLPSTSIVIFVAPRARLAASSFASGGSLTGVTVTVTVAPPRAVPAVAV